MTTTNNELIRPACILICAADGDVRAARGLVAKALRSTLPKGRSCSYVSSGEARSYGLREPRYTFDCTEPEFLKITASISEAAKEAGFNQNPTDAYRD